MQINSRNVSSYQWVKILSDAYSNSIQLIFFFHLVVKNPTFASLVFPPLLLCAEQAFLQAEETAL